MAYDEETRGAIFNAGVAFAERIDSLQRAINAARFNPLALNPDTGTFNYEIMQSALDSLLNTSWGKLNRDEKEFGERMRKVVKAFIKSNPPITKSGNGEPKISKQNYEKLVELLDFYEKVIQVFYDNHNLNNPDAQEFGEGW